jgi:hypothetical protein
LEKNVLTINIDQKSISAWSAGQLDLDAMAANLALPQSDASTKCVQISQHGYILSRSFQASDALLTISLSREGPIASLNEDVRQEAIARILKCATMFVTGRMRSIPVSWRAFHSKNQLTFQADRRLRSADGGLTDAGRIVTEIAHDIGPRVFAYLLDRSGTKDLSIFKPPRDLLQAALHGVSLALAQPELTVGKSVLGNDVTLDESLPSKLKGHITTEDWYAARFTSAQRSFVDHPYSGSVRLVGPAGSGKTVALVVKCLRGLTATNLDHERKRFLFLTHASATATAVENLVLSMEPVRGFDLMASDKPALTVTTLYSLANRQMRYDLDELTPISLDGHEGRAFQADVLNEVVEIYRKGDWITYKSDCSAPFVAYMESDQDSHQRHFFLWELLNEFACVLDAEGVRNGVARRDQYLNEKRKNWMMLLPTRAEREVVLHLYDRFRSWLRDIKAIGGDQMVTDFLNHLDTFRWEATRDQEGYDAIFVDELHLFNRQERMVFRHLLRNPHAAPAVFMAYDAKQSPRDTFLKLPSSDAQHFDLWKDAKLGKVEKIELVDVFRYSPQIATTLSCIDDAFPGQDLDDDWPKYSGISRSADGPIPTICTLPTTSTTYAIVFKRARLLQKNLGKDGRVAVLCVSNELFKRHLDFTNFREIFHAITSREEASGIPQSPKKFVFSMPEYVAGLQFDTVLLIEVNKDEVPQGPYATAALRKFVSQIYLGASRAERQLEFYASGEHGGVAPILSRAVLDGAIRVIKEQDLARE